MNRTIRIVTLIMTMTMTSLTSTSAVAQEFAVSGDHYITVDGITLHYRTGGSGPAVLLLHGFTLSGEQWAPFLEEFARHYTVIAVDMPGHGKSDLLGERFSFERWTELMTQMLDHMGIERIRGIGHSAGAITLLHIAVKHPDLIESMVLVGGAHLYTETAREELRHDSFEKAPESLQEYYREIHFGDQAKITALFDDINDMADRIPVSPENAVLNASVLANISMPVLLVWGDRDFYFPVDIAVELYRLLPDARLWVIPDQGHTPVWSFMGGDEQAEHLFPERVKLFFDTNNR